jgi:negative regulator of sigma-B (phosphoserine phosphatase)
MEVQQSTDPQQHQQSSLVEWAVGRQSKTQSSSSKGEPHKTEVPILKATPSGILCALLDAVGQDASAAEAARRAAEPFEQYTHQSLTELFARSDKALESGNGVAVTAAMFNVGFNTISWFGVGHVKGVLFRRSPAADPRFHRLELVSGLLGTGQVRLREICLPIKPGDLLIFATEGISDSFVEALPIDGKPRVVADQLMAKYCAPDADCCMIVVRYLGLP